MDLRTLIKNTITYEKFPKLDSKIEQLPEGLLEAVKTIQSPKIAKILSDLALKIEGKANNYNELERYILDNPQQAFNELEEQVSAGKLSIQKFKLLFKFYSRYFKLKTLIQ